MCVVTMAGIGFCDVVNREGVIMQIQANGYDKTGCDVFITPFVTVPDDAQPVMMMYRCLVVKGISWDGPPARVVEQVDICDARGRELYSINLVTGVVTDMAL